MTLHELVPWLDKINFVAEVLILFPFIQDCRTLYKAKDSRAINLMSGYQYAAYSLYCGVFYTGLTQWWSVTISIVWAIAHAIRIFLIIKFKPKKEV